MTSFNKPARSIVSLVWLAAIVILLGTLGCSNSEEDPAPEERAEAATGCRSCHSMELDTDHQFECTSCHGGDETITDPALVHSDVVYQPAHPDQAATYCGPCHAAETEMVEDSNHYSLAKHVTLVRSAFGATDEAATATALQSYPEPDSAIELVDDLLRRRCLRCHVYSAGDDFPLVRRATGCGACHLAYENGSMVSHRFQEMVRDDRCLSCHYGNHVGFDYHGRSEQDFNEEYRTPYTAPEEPRRDFGVEFHQLAPDVHQVAGMGCIDCHEKGQVMGGAAGTISCRSCHDPEYLAYTADLPIRKKKDGFIFTTAAGGKELAVPLMEHAAHSSYPDLSCQVCHANWTFNDGETSLLRMDHDEFDDFYKLTLDGSHEVHSVLYSHFSEEGEILDTLMTDKFTGQMLPGIWFKGFSERRWELPLFVRDDDGLLYPARPILDLHISWIDEDEEVRFDNLAPLPGNLLNLPYVPHTTGKAGMFYEQRLLDLGVISRSGLKPAQK